MDTHQDSKFAANTSGRGSRNLFLTKTPGAVGLLLLAQSKSLELQAFFLEPVVICNCCNWQASSSSLYIRQFLQTGLTASGTFLKQHLLPDFDSLAKHCVDKAKSLPGK